MVLNYILVGCPWMQANSPEVEWLEFLRQNIQVKKAKEKLGSWSFLVHLLEKTCNYYNKPGNFTSWWRACEIAMKCTKRALCTCRLLKSIGLKTYWFYDVPVADAVVTFKLPNFFHVERNFSRAPELKKYSLRFRQSSAAASHFFFFLIKK